MPDGWSARGSPRFPTRARHRLRPRRRHRWPPRYARADEAWARSATRTIIGVPADIGERSCQAGASRRAGPGMHDGEGGRTIGARTQLPAAGAYGSTAHAARHAYWRASSPSITGIPCADGVRPACPRGRSVPARRGRIRAWPLQSGQTRISSSRLSIVVIPCRVASPCLRRAACPATVRRGRRCAPCTSAADFFDQARVDHGRGGDDPDARVVEAVAFTASFSVIRITSAIERRRMVHERVRRQSRSGPAAAAGLSCRPGAAQAGEEPLGVADAGRGQHAPPREGGPSGRTMVGSAQLPGIVEFQLHAVDIGPWSGGAEV